MLYVADTVDINPVIAKETKESLIEEVTKENEEVPTIKTELSTNGIEGVCYNYITNGDKITRDLHYYITYRCKNIKF